MIWPVFLAPFLKVLLEQDLNNRIAATECHKLSDIKIARRHKMTLSHVKNYRDWCLAERFKRAV